MSCQIQQIGNIQDILSIRQCLFPTDDLKGSDSWLQSCEISVSPTGDLIAIANDRNLVILTSKWDSTNDLSQFHVTYSGSIHRYDKVKSILCLPIVGISPSSHVGPDWTCILVGYDSGYIRFYTENSELLFEDQLHNENICSIKCQSQHSPRPDISPELHPEEVYVQYQSNVCVLNGPELFSILRTCRSQLASGKLPEKPTHLSLRKWGFQDQNVIKDTQVVGLNLSNSFDHLLTASTNGGFETKFRTMPPHNTLVLAAGSKPFVGYHYALEGGPQPVFSDVAKAVASKLKSALPSWLVGNNSASKVAAVEANLSVNHPVEPMGCRFGLCDLQRTSTNIVLSNDRKLAAVSDSLGRVLLIDAFRGIVLRIFKGYRDAQCSFIQVKANESVKSTSKIHRIATFFVIYSAKKGTIEIFTVQQGMTVTTFTASKYSRLLYINYGLMGFQKTTKSRYICNFNTIFIDSDGKIKEIQVPFHYSLTEKSSKRSRDVHLYKKLKHLIKNEEFDEEIVGNEAYRTCTELNTVEIQQQTVEMLLHSSQLSVKIILDCLKYFVEKNKELEEEHKFKVLVENAYRLVKFYEYLNVTFDDDESDSSVLENTLNLNPKDLQKLHDLNALVDNSVNNEIKVTFSDCNQFTVVNFISLFDLTMPQKVHLKTNVDETLLFKASETLYKQYLTDNKNVPDAFSMEIINSKIVIKDLFILLIKYWVNRTFYLKTNLENEMMILSRLIAILVNIAKQVEDVIVEYNSTSIFWSEIREVLADLRKPFPALTAAILCKFVAHNLEMELDKIDVNELEILSQENCLWTLLIGKLEDVSLLNIILSTRFESGGNGLPKLKHSVKDISLRYILEGGRGSVSELVAQWLTVTGTSPSNVVDYQGDDKVCTNLNLLRSQFPYSLEGSALLANMSWEYALAWQKDIENMDLMEACLKCASSVPNVHVKQGLYNLLWNTHLKIMFENVCKLINKVRKLPKERLCRQDTGLSDFQLYIFIVISVDFLDAFMDIVQECCNSCEPVPTLNFEPIWDSGGNPQPLVELAIQQREINYDLLHLHYQLGLIVQMLTAFEVRYSKPIYSLFDGHYSNYFFMDFQNNSAQIKLHNKVYDENSKLKALRVQFLCKIIRASIETIAVNQENQIYSKEHVLWMSKCLLLASLWNLDCDELKCYQVVQVFTSGFDTLGEELMTAVNNTKILGEKLLVIGAKRLNQYLVASPGLNENISALSPTLTTYLDSLDEDWCEQSTLPAITNVATHVVRSLNENQKEYKLAQLLLEACLTLEEINS